MDHYSAVIFDMDGVIVDSEPHHEQAVHDVIRELGYGSLECLDFRDFLGRSDVEMWTAFSAVHKPSQSVDELTAMKRNRVVQAMLTAQPIFPGVLKLIEKLATRCPLAVASGSEYPVIDAVLEPNGLRRFFTAVVSASDVPRGKPAPDVFLRAAELLKVAPRECWVLEDSKPGLAAALAAGMRVIAIANTHPAEELVRATHVVNSYEEIERLLLP